MAVWNYSTGMAYVYVTSTSHRESDSPGGLTVQTMTGKQGTIPERIQKTEGEVCYCSAIVGRQQQTWHVAMHHRHTRESKRGLLLLHHYRKTATDMTSGYAPSPMAAQHVCDLRGCGKAFRKEIRLIEHKQETQRIEEQLAQIALPHSSKVLDQLQEPLPEVILHG